MTMDPSPYLDIWVELPGGRVIKLSLPNKDVSVNDIVVGLINEGFLASRHRYRMVQVLTRELKLYDIARQDGNLFVVLEDKKAEGSKMPIDNKKVFIVHGHQVGLRETVARFLQSLGAKPIILQEQPSLGMTVIEKLEEYSDVGFAVILMTGDDRGGTKDTILKKQSLRARQNVVLELGFFLSRLGRRKVCVLYEPGVEIPSDYAGVIYIQYDDANGWKIRMARELKAAGLDIDLNGLIAP